MNTEITLTGVLGIAIIHLWRRQTVIFDEMKRTDAAMLQYILEVRPFVCEEPKCSNRQQQELPEHIKNILNPPTRMKTRMKSMLALTLTLLILALCAVTA